MPVPSARDFIYLQGCRQHNLKNIALKIPKQAITVITGVSGSGKSSLAFDTLFAEGQRRYLEYLSLQARVWIKQMAKPQVDLIEGLSPTLAIGQGRQELYPLGILATYTDIYDFLTLLYTGIGEQHSPATGKRLIRYTRQEIIDLILKEYPAGMRLQLLAPVKLQKETFHQAVTRLQQMGFIRLRIEGQDWVSEDPLPSLEEVSQLEVIVDRIEIKEGIRDRLAHSIETAMDLSQGILKVQEGREGRFHYFTEIYVCPETGLSFPPLEAADFNFNSSRGACPLCLGLGGQEKVNPQLLLSDSEWPLIEQIRFLIDHLPKKTAYPIQQLFSSFWNFLKLPDDTRLSDLPSSLLEPLLYGSAHIFAHSLSVSGEDLLVKQQWQGLVPLLEQALQTKKTRGSLSELPFIEWQECPACQGARLKPESLACLIQGKNIHQLCSLTVTALLNELKAWSLTGKAALIAKEIIPHILTRLAFLEQVGLSYLTLDRRGKTLSEGEAQRVRLASQIGAKLSGVTYILDEPSLGLHRQDIQHLHQVIEELKELGNTVILVEHEKSLIKQADYLIELGPGAGRFGGQLTFKGSFQELLKDPNSLTGQWLSGKRKLPKPPHRKPKHGWLTVQSASLHNLNNFSVNIPLACLVGFCGVSGSGKSTLVLDMIGKQIQEYLSRSVALRSLQGYESLKRLVMSQKQAERFSARSIPATYVGLMTPLRQLFAETRLAKARGYTASRFSLNKRGGRCEACEGLGQIRANMQLMPDLYIPCEVCQGLRYNYETLQITWENYTIADILSLSAQEAYQVFRYIPAMAPALEMMTELGLDYLTLGQPFNTLSGGEIQRLKLVADLAEKNLEPTLYILDEPSAGLHVQDLEKLLKILHRLVDKGHSIFMIEHHLDLLQQADWLIELGPGGGPQGGRLIFEGAPSKLSKAPTPTGKVFAQLMDK
ncbi:excinuclease ABC subunit UvrA [Candidatus Protochlamydia phocaeensis]|uniref:excinuclease ABC subunit UvrA n=1 Tax=Candidatus Protochlamydia phocaeensis TaxID=1414722 RepID=UPI0008398843|nr:excinuclease ABC subunit UvrA [Candidatus Protochlamydia phocaeensis]